jgi:SAM-dependent methyltransferase
MAAKLSCANALSGPAGGAGPHTWLGMSGTFAPSMGSTLTSDELRGISMQTLDHYERSAEQFWAGTHDHDVSENHAAFLSAIVVPPPFALLDFGCGPGRDLRHFASLGHRAVGLDGCASFCEMARRHSGCEVLHQDFLRLDLPRACFDGVFANASLFHVPSQELARVLGELRDALEPRGVLFTSNPRGDGREGWSSGRYACFHDLESWRRHLDRAGFDELSHYYRPPGKPRHEQPWLASVWRKRER